LQILNLQLYGRRGSKSPSAVFFERFGWFHELIFRSRERLQRFFRRHWGFLNKLADYERGALNDLPSQSALDPQGGER